MNRTYSILDAANAGADLTVQSGGVLLTTDTSGLNINRSCRGTVPVDEYEHRIQFIVFGEGTLTNKVSIGLVTGDFTFSAYVGANSDSIGYRFAEGQIHNGGSSIGSVTAGATGDVVDLILRFADEGVAQVSWRLNGIELTTLDVPSAMLGEPLYWAVSLGSDADAGDIQIHVNAGQDDYEYPQGDSGLGWFSVADVASMIRISDEDYLSAADDDDPNARFHGMITEADAVIESAVHFWCWGDQAAARGSLLTVSVTDPDGITDPLLGGTSRDLLTVLLRTDGTLSDAEDLGAFVFERAEVVDEITRRLYFRDQLALFERGIQRRRIRPDASEDSANRYAPTTIGPAFSIEAVLIDDLEYRYMIDSLGCDQIGRVRDAGDPFTNQGSAPDYTIEDGGTVIELATVPFGIITVDAATTGSGYIPPAPVDILGGDGDPFDGTIGMDPTNWTSTGAAELAASNRVTFEQDYLQNSWMEHDSAQMVAGSTYRVEFTVHSLQHVVSAGSTARVGLFAGQNPLSPLISVQSSGIAGRATSVLTGEVTLPYTFRAVIAPLSTIDVTLGYLGNNVIAPGTDCEVSALTVLELDTPDDSDPDDELDEALYPLPLAEMLRQMIEVRGRFDADVWSTTDAEAIDTATGYAGTGYHSRSQAKVIDALREILHSYCASPYLDSTGTLRFLRLFAPEDATADGTLDEGDILTPPLPRLDEAKGLTTTIGVRRNERILTDADLVTDDVDVTLRLRRKLGRQYRFIRTYGGPLAPCYEHARTADLLESRLVKPDDGRDEIGYVCGLYQRPRSFYGPFEVAGRSDLEIGQVMTTTFDGFGLENGKKLAVVGLRRLLNSDTQWVTLWGLAMGED